MTNFNFKLIRCGDHQLAPSALTCVHICKGTATAVVPIPQEDGSEIENDWLCPDCYEKFVVNDNGGLDDLQVVCIHCLREILKPYQK